MRFIFSKKEASLVVCATVGTKSATTSIEVIPIFYYSVSIRLQIKNGGGVHSN